jgi:hypothetical protein
MSDYGPSLHAIRQAWEHICSRTLADATLAECLACLHDPQVQAAEARVNAVAAAADIQQAADARHTWNTGAVQQAQEACQAWNIAYKHALARVRQEAA